MTVGELLEKLKGVNPSALVMLFTTDPTDDNQDGWFPMTLVEYDDAVQVPDRAGCLAWMVGSYDPVNAVPAVWFE